jgi:hypothetical protein
MVAIDNYKKIAKPRVQFHVYFMNVTIAILTSSVVIFRYFVGGDLEGYESIYDAIYLGNIVIQEPFQIIVSEIIQYFGLSYMWLVYVYNIIAVCILVNLIGYKKHYSGFLAGIIILISLPLTLHYTKLFLAATLFTYFYLGRGRYYFSSVFVHVFSILILLFEYLSKISRQKRIYSFGVIILFVIFLDLVLSRGLLGGDYIDTLDPSLMVLSYLVKLNQGASQGLVPEYQFPIAMFFILVTIFFLDKKRDYFYIVLLIFLISNFQHLFSYINRVTMLICFYLLLKSVYKKIDYKMFAVFASYSLYGSILLTVNYPEFFN